MNDTEHRGASSELTATSADAQSPPRTWKYYVGMGCIALAVLAPLAGLVVYFLPLPSALKTTLTGALLLAGPEIFLVLGAAFAGKEAVQTIKSKIKALLGIKGSPKPVNRVRYNIGLAILITGVVIQLASVYGPTILHVEMSPRLSFFGNLTGDLLVIVGFFVLGKQFWEKIQNLFVWEPEPQTVAPTTR